MAIISSRTAACLAGLVLSGCMQSIPSADAITRPTAEAFTRLSAWRPWEREPERPAQAHPPQSAELPRAEPIPASPPVPEPRATMRPPRTAIATPPSVTPRRIEAKQYTQPISAAAPVSSPVPTLVSCQTTAQPGQRVRMECTPLE